jgi:ATP/maltotriose-dependent transcriptional regulator MalT
LIEEYARLTNFPSQFQVLLGWLDRLPDAFVRTQPTLCIMHAITLVFTHQLEKASARVQDAERCLEEEMPAQQRCTLLSLIAAFLGYQARFLGNYGHGVPLGKQAIELMPETEVMSPLMVIFRLGTFPSMKGHRWLPYCVRLTSTR